ncbi:MAG: hypothetical protein WDW21_03830 [Neisseriaceae bacterium]
MDSSAEGNSERGREEASSGIQLNREDEDCKLDNEANPAKDREGSKEGAELAEEIDRGSHTLDKEDKTDKGASRGIEEAELRLLSAELN